MKEITSIINEIDTLKKQFDKNKQKITELDGKIQEVILDSNNTKALETISNQIVDLKKNNENIDGIILELERKLEILHRYELENL